MNLEHLKTLTLAILADLGPSMALRALNDEADYDLFPAVSELADEGKVTLLRWSTGPVIVTLAP